LNVYPSIIDMQTVVQQLEYERGLIERRNRMLRAAELPPFRFPWSTRIAEFAGRTKIAAPTAIDQPEPCASCA
jgi:hypothetical protein